MDMAVGIIIGAAFTAIVSSLVADLINPIIGLFTGCIDFTNKYAVLSGEVAAGSSLEAAREAGASVFAYGSFIMAVINFLIIAWVVFMLVKFSEQSKSCSGSAERRGTCCRSWPVRKGHSASNPGRTGQISFGRRSPTIRSNDQTARYQRRAVFTFGCV